MGRTIDKNLVPESEETRLPRTPAQSAPLNIVQIPIAQFKRLSTPFSKNKQETQVSSASLGHPAWSFIDSDRPEQDDPTIACRGIELHQSESAAHLIIVLNNRRMADASD
jgi:hypothetical protein